MSGLSGVATALGGGMSERLQQARAYVASGVSLIPIGANSKASPIRWKDYQERMPAVEELTVWDGRYPGIGIVCGRISKNLEVLDLEADAPLVEFQRLVDALDPTLLPKLPRTKTPTGGRLIFFDVQSLQAIKN